MAKYWGSSEENRKRRKGPFFTRPWFWVPLLVLFLGGVALVVAGWVYVQPFKKRAESFDLDKVGQLPSASFIYDRKERVIGQIYIENRYVVPLAEMGPMEKAVRAAEDARFYDHDGVDLYGIGRAIVRNLLAHEAQQGASTITQQLARNTFGLKERSIDRKLVEAFLAWRIEKRYDKKRIMENYLNLIFFGRGFYGVEAASRGYFGKHAKELSISESAALAGLIASPNNREPWSYYEGFKGNRDRVLGRMRDLGFITKQEYADGIADPLKIADRVPIQSQSYILDYVRQKVIDNIGWEAATSDGYNVYTSIDLEIQNAAQISLERNLANLEKKRGYKHQTYADYKKERDDIVNTALKKAYDSGTPDSVNPFNLVKPPEYLQGAAVVLENKTGAILAMVGGRDFAHSEFNRAMYARRPSGTAFLPIVYATAFQNGFFPGSLLQDSVMDNRKVMIGGDSGILGEWGPESETNRYEGPIPARFALMKSKNAAGVRMGYIAGLNNVLATAKKMGVNSPLDKFPATFLGKSNTTLAEMALAYTNFPNGGWHEKDTHIITKILSSSGKPVPLPTSERVRGLDSTAAYEVHSVLTDALRNGTGARSKELGLKDFEAGGKTGTAYDFTDLTFFGYSSEVTCAVWAGFDANGKSISQGAFSNQVVLPVWVDVMNAAYDNFAPQKIPVPLGLEKVEVCLRSGELATDKCFEIRPPKKPGEEGERWRCTYIEYATPDQKPKIACRLHTGTGMTLDQYFGRKEEPGVLRADAVDAGDQQAVDVMSKTIIGIDEDPYHSMKPIKREEALLDTKNKTTVQLPAKEVLKATPVGPLDSPTNTNSAPLERPAPLDLDKLGN